MQEDYPHIVINVGGVDRKYRFDMKAIWDYQKATGLSLSQLKDTERLVDKDVSIGIKMVWAGLYRFDQSLKPEDVAEMLSPKQYRELIEIVSQYVAETMRGEDEKNLKRATSESSNEKNGAGTPPSKQPAGSA